MQGKKGLKLIVETVVFEIIVLMVLLFFAARSSDVPVDVGLLATMFALLIPFGISAVFFLGRYLEKHDYRREDVKRLYIALEETWGRDRFVKDVQEIIGYHIIAWYLLGMAFFMTGNVVEAAISVVAISLKIFSFTPLFLLMWQWIIDIPFTLYALASGKEWTVTSARNTGLWIIQASIFGAGLLVGIYFLGHTVENSSLEIVERLLKLGRNGHIIKNLLLLSVQSAVFGAVEAYFFPKRKKLAFLVLIAVAALGTVIVWDMLLGA
ncbi:hypothetical protein A3L09_02695 [Thermococcus profundus]|uniref:Uncharacterized protein n=1 Tax=Thermococcus profundus TaxID=49899 RepID=A0A2Z2MC47_THEPR|nr:hypothetical protein [Thermococcus profundus]ASJ02252.1 hypothetical protein A3L09_02695 [Thermococcus profundus]